MKKKFLLLLILATILISCRTEETEDGRGTKDIKVVLSDELKNLNINVIDQYIGDYSTRYARLFIIFDKDISALIEEGVVIFRALSKDDFELVGGFLDRQPIEVGSTKLPDDRLDNRAYVYNQLLRPIAWNLIKKIKIEIYKSEEN